MSTGPSLGPSTDDLRATLTRHAAAATGTVPTTTRASLAVGRARRHRSRRRTLVGAGLATAAVAAVAVVGLPGGSGPSEPTAPSAAVSIGVADARSPRLAGYRYPETVTVDGLTYRLGTSYISSGGSRTLRIETVAADPDYALVWSSTPGTRGDLVARIDGQAVSRSTAGGRESGTVVRGGRVHVITLRVSARLRAGERLALATYQR